MITGIVNCSSYGMKPGDRIYNLATHKLANYYRRQNDEVVCGLWRPIIAQNCERICFSAIFTWDVPRLIEQVKLARIWGKEVEIGGPAATFKAKLIEKETGIKPHCGLDQRFEHVPGNYRITHTSRGCPHGCKFCGVNRLEPELVEYNDFQLAPIIGDNNLLATSWDHQQLVVDKFTSYGEVDINSGFDVRFFTPDHFELYSRLRLKTWRFAFDSMDVEPDVRRVLEFMRRKGFDRHKVTVYALIGFPGTTPEECHYRLGTIIELGMNPYCMRFWPLNRLDRKYVASGWTEDLLQRMNIYYQSPNTWMTCGFEEFNSSLSKKPAASPNVK